VRVKWMFVWKKFLLIVLPMIWAIGTFLLSPAGPVFGNPVMPVVAALIAVSFTIVCFGVFGAFAIGMWLAPESFQTYMLGMASGAVAGAFLSLLAMWIW